jgi:hypothetical protein
VLPGIQGLLIGDKGYISKPLQKELFIYHHVDLETPLRTAIPATDLVTPLSIFKERSLRG